MEERGLQKKRDVLEEKEGYWGKGWVTRRNEGLLGKKCYWEKEGVFEKKRGLLG